MKRIAIYNRYWNTRGGGERYAAVLADTLARHHWVELLGVEPVDLAGLSGHLGLDLGACTFRLMPRGPERVLAPSTAEYDLLFNCTYLSRLPSRAERSIYVVLFPQRVWPPLAVAAARRAAWLASFGALTPPENDLSWEDRAKVDRLDNSGLVPRLRSLAARAESWLDGHDAAVPASYDLLLSISEYTRRWVADRWGSPSTVLPPPVDTETFGAGDPRAKEKRILSVGRFFHGSHNKKHLEMLRVFRGMVDRGEVPEGWEYHLAGTIQRKRAVDVEYLAELERLAEGYPVKLLVDLELGRLIDEYRRAAIFWHAAGWGEDEGRQPEKLEHFGLSTCEAMASGCVPVVIAKAGQLEIVDHGVTGFLFETGEELAGYTRSLMDDFGEPHVWEMGERAMAAVQRFARPRFEERLWHILETRDLLHRPAG